MQANAINMPMPAISPSCATPTNEVGRKARNPAAVATAATSTWMPTRRAVAARARRTSASRSRTSRKRTLNWMAKSTAMPVNSTAKATEIRFSVPTARAANPVVSSRPSSSVSSMGAISRQERTARNSHTAISRKLPTRPAMAPCNAVANSSSASGTAPVTRTCARPAATNSSLAAAARRSAVAAPPGCRAP